MSSSTWFRRAEINTSIAPICETRPRSGRLPVFKTFLVARREFLAAVLTKGFLLGILLPPIIMTAALTLMPLLMNSAAPKTAGTIAVIDQSGLVADALK